MTFFYDLNKRMADLAAKQDQRLDESVQAVAERSTGDYSAKKARAGKDIGKPGKMFSKIAKSAGERYGSKAAGERVAGAVLNKLRHPKEGMETEGNAFTGALAKTPKGGKFNVGGKEFTDTSSLEEVGGTPMTPKQKKFAKLAPPADKITFADKIAGAKQEVDEMLGDVAAEAMKAAVGKIREADNPGLEEDEMSEGFKEMDAWLKQREAEKGTGKFDRKERTLPGGMKATTYTRRHEDDAEDDAEVSSEPKRRGRPAGKAKGPERVTKGAWKHKGERKVKEAESKCCPHCGKSLEEEELDEKAVSKAQQKFMGMVHAAQKGEKPASKEVAKVAKEMPKKAAKDFASTKHKGLPEKVKAKKEEKVEEIAVGGGNKSSEGPDHKIKGIEVGKGIYEGLDRQFAQALTEGMNISVNMSTGDNGEPTKSINISADGDDANKLAELLKMAGLDSSAYEKQPCPQCGSSDCGCEEIVDENKPDWPTNSETSDNALQYSGGLNKPKSTGQTTIPVIANQGRQTSMEEGIELERSLFKLYKDFTAK